MVRQTFYDRLIEAQHSGVDVWARYAKKRYDAFNAMNGNVNQNRLNFLSSCGTLYGNVADRIGIMPGRINGMPDAFTNKSALAVCGLIDSADHMHGIDVSTHPDYGYVVSIFASCANRMYTDTVNASAQSILYIGQGGLERGKEKPLVIADQRRDNRYNEAMIDTFKASRSRPLPVRVFTTDHPPDDDKNTIKFIGMYTIVAYGTRRVDQSGEVLPENQEGGFVQFVFTLNRM
jgi:hypothetical protein